ncbi:Uncharacterized protein TCM_042328 [Theobroma cacao]|uniref:Uncharacterized protein n=1 Tax=Theobroma cacao TaxID=3641 RepID=A0A061GZ23_THECC|nr:Uncharacterized protein TCM_042328 [Theobroma cacao]
MISGLIWNVRGISGRVIQRRLKKLQLMHKIKILAILEPMVDISKAEFFRRKLGFEKVIVNSSQKIWLFHSLELHSDIILDHPQCLHVRLTSPWLEKSFFATFVYAKCTRSERTFLWDCLRRLAADIEVPWLVGGDFNIILKREERLYGSAPHEGSMEDFASVLLDCGLLDGGFEGNPFTWTNNRMFQRLDRVVYNHQWINMFPITRIQHLNRDGSDHCPLLISCFISNEKSPSSFRFQHAWVLHHDFKTSVEGNWNLPINGSGLQAFWSKQHRLKQHLKWWNKAVFGDIFSKLKEAEKRVEKCEILHQQEQTIIAQATGFNHQLLPITYLGAPLYKGHKKVILFNDLVAKIEERITGWENKILSPGGRITLLRSVLASLPIYLLQVLKPPVCILERVNSLAEVFEAFSMKLWWRFRTIDSLWTRFMRMKYCRGQLPMQTQPKLHDSQTWKRMLTSSATTEQHMRWRVGQGNLFFWHDCWMGDAPLISSNQEFTSSMVQVCDFFMNNSWNVEKLKTVLQQEVVDEIAKIPIDTMSKDEAYWTPTPNGDFSTKSAWQLIRKRKVVNPVFNFIWHKTVPLTTSFFLWRLLHDWIPVELKMKSKGLQLASRCRCCKSEESIMHVMWDNPVAMQVWNYFAKLFQICIINPCTINQIIGAWFHSGDYCKPGHIRTLVPLFILWFLWVERNDAKHRNLGMYPNRVVWRVLKLIQQLSLGQQLLKWQWKGDKQIAQEWGIILQAESLAPPKVFSWHKPTTGEFKLNVDGSAKHSHNAAGGGILRDHAGVMVFGFSENLGIQNSLQAELLALYRGLILCRDYNIRRLWIEMDAISVIRLLQGNHRGPHAIRYLMVSLRQLLSHFSFRFSHIFREGNQAADFLANRGHEHQNLQVFTVAQGKLRGMLRLDQTSFPYVRFK